MTDPRSPIDIVRERHPAAFCRPMRVLESDPPRVASWQVVDGYDDRPVGPAAGSESQAWTLAAEECHKDAPGSAAQPLT